MTNAELTVTRTECWIVMVQGKPRGVFISESDAQRFINVDNPRYAELGAEIITSKILETQMSDPVTTILTP